MNTADIAQLSGRDLDAAIGARFYDRHNMATRLPAYSKKDMIAFHLADKVKLFQAGYDLSCNDDGSIWYVAPRFDDERWACTGATRAEAICRAALMLAEEGKAS